MRITIELASFNEEGRVQIAKCTTTKEALKKLAGDDAWRVRAAATENPNYKQ